MVQRVLITGFFFLSVFLLFASGLFLIVGALKGTKILMNVKVSWWNRFPDRILNRMGRRAFLYYYILAGAALILAGIVILLDTFR